MTLTTENPYSKGRLLYDADSHIMELPGWVKEYAAPGIRDQLVPWGEEGPMAPMLEAAPGKVTSRRDDAATAEAAEANLLNDKLWDAIGAFDPGERSRAIDLLGFQRQLIFPTVAPALFQKSQDHDVQYGGAEAYNRAMADFCRGDERLMGVGYVPLLDPARTRAEAERAIADGIDAILIDTVPPADGPSATHPDHDGFWSVLQEAKVPGVLHVTFSFQPNGWWRTVPPGFYRNGLDMRNKFKGEAGEQVDAYGLTAISHPAEIALMTFVFDGLLERFPDLRIGCIEQTAIWVVSWLRTIDQTFTIFNQAHPHLANLTMKPSEYVQRQVRFTPFIFEPVEWLIEQGGEDLFMFSSDYPHTEGGRDPLGSFDKRLDGVDEKARDKFFHGNFADLFGNKF